MSDHPASLSLRAWELYIASMSISTGPRLLLVTIVGAVLREQPFQPSTEALGRLMHRSERTIGRWARTLRQRGFVRVIRRGRAHSNVYRLTRAFWRRVTGRRPLKLPLEIQASLWKIGQHIGVEPATMRRAGIRRVGRV